MVSNLHTEKASAAQNPDMAHGAIWCVHQQYPPGILDDWATREDLSRHSLRQVLPCDENLCWICIGRQGKAEKSKMDPKKCFIISCDVVIVMQEKLPRLFLGYFFAWGPRFSILFRRKGVKRYLILVHRSCAHLFCIFWPGAWRACLLCNFNPFRSFPKSLSPTTICRFHFWSQRHFIQNRSALDSPYDEADRTHNVKIISIAATWLSDFSVSRNDVALSS